MRCLYEWATSLAARGGVTNAEVDELLEAASLVARGEAGPADDGATPPTDAVVSALLPLCRFLTCLAADDAAAAPGAVDAVAARVAGLVSSLRGSDAAAASGGGGPAARASAGRWQAAFAALNTELRGLLDGAAPSVPAAGRAAISAAYADLVRAWLPRFGLGGLEGGSPPPPANATARMLTGFKRALRDPARPLPLLPGDAAALLQTVAGVLGVGGGGGGGGGLATPPPVRGHHHHHHRRLSRAGAEAASAAANGAPSPFTDDTARALGVHAPDDTALALAAQLLRAAGVGGGGDGDGAPATPLTPADRDLRTGLLAAACRTLRTALRDVLGPDGSGGGGGGGMAGGSGFLGVDGLSASEDEAGGGHGAAGNGPTPGSAPGGLRLPSASFAAATARLAADLAISLAVGAGSGGGGGGGGGAPVPPPPDSQAPPPPPVPRPSSAAFAAAASLTSTADLLVEAAEACVALAWQVGQASPAAGRALAIAAAVLRAAGPLLAAAAGARVVGALDAPERVHAIMRSAARLAEEADVRAAMGGGGGGGGAATAAASPTPPGFARVWRWDVGGLQSGVGELRPRPAGEPSPVRRKSAAAPASPPPRRTSSLASATSAPLGAAPSGASPPRLDRLPSSWALAPPPPPHPAAAAAAAAERLCDEASAALTRTLAAQWVAGEAEAVKAALVPLADLSAQADAGGASPREQQAELLTAGRLAASLAGEPDMLAVVVPLLSESGVGGSAPAVRACAVHVVACLAALAGRVGAAWAHDAQVDALVKAYKAPDGYAAPLLWAGVVGGGGGGGGGGGDASSTTPHDAPWAADACPGALADALLTVAAGCSAAPPPVRSDLLLRLLALFADVGAAARPGDGGAARDLGALLPALAVAADGVIGVDGGLVVGGDGWGGGGGGGGGGAAAPPPPRPSSPPPPKQGGSGALLASTSFGRPHAAAPADVVKALRLAWLYIAVHGLAGVKGASGGGAPVAVCLPPSAYAAAPPAPLLLLAPPPPPPSRRGRLWSALPGGGASSPHAWSTASPTVWPAAWRAAAGRLAALTPTIAVLSEGESVKLGAELGARLHRLGGAALGAAAAAATAELVGRAAAPPPPAAHSPPEAWARAAHVFSVAVLELARAEAAPLSVVGEGGPAAAPCPLDPALSALARLEPGMWVGPWLGAITAAAAASYCARLRGSGRVVPPSPDPPSAVSPCLDGLVRSLVASTSPSSGGGGEPAADGLAARLLGSVLAEFPTLHWRPVLLQSLLASLGAHEAWAARAGMPAAAAVGGLVPLAAAAAAGGTSSADPSLALTRRVLGVAAAAAPEHAEALLHEPLRGGGGGGGGGGGDGPSSSSPALRHAADLMATVDAARPPPDPDAVAAPITGVEALSRKSYYGGLAAGGVCGGGLAGAVDALEAAVAAAACGGGEGGGEGDAPPPPLLEDRILAAAAALVTAPTDPAAHAAVHALAWAPARVLTPATVRAAVLGWAWVAAAAPGLRAPLVAAVGAAWLATVDAQAGIFSSEYDAEAFHMTPGGDPDDHPALARGVRAHGAWLAYWAEVWAAFGGRGVGTDAAAVRAVLARVLHRSLADGRGLTQHPAAAGARARLVVLALRVARAMEGEARGGAASPSPPASAAVLCQRALRAALLWHEGPPAWYGRWTPAEAADQAAAAAEVLAAVTAVPVWPALAPAAPPPGSPIGAAGTDPVWGPADPATTTADRVGLLALLQAAEAERTAVWAQPMDDVGVAVAVAGRGHGSLASATARLARPGGWDRLAATAWDVSPRLALALPERLPACAALEASLRDLVWARAHDPAIQAVPAAAALLAGDDRLLAGYGAAAAAAGGHNKPGRAKHHGPAPAALTALASAAADRMDALTLWSPAPLLQALAMLGGPAGAIPAVRGYALRSLDRCPPAQVAVFLPQLVQLLRADAGGQIAAYLLAAARKSVLYAHILLCTLKAEGTPPPDAFAPAVKRSGWRPPADTGLWAIADGLAARVAGAMPPDKADHLAAELDFFDAVTAVSGELYPVAKDERKNEAVRLVKEIPLPRPDLYLPTNPDARILAVIPESATPMQSAAKVPILVAFEVEVGGSGGGGGGGRGVASEDSRSATPPPPPPRAASPPPPHHLARTTTQACIFKVGDDCRQDVLALQVIRLLADALAKAGLDLYLAPYGVIPTAYECGIIEVVPDCRSRSALGETCDGGLFDIFRREFGAPGSARFEAARRNFIASAAGYAVACYLLQAKDRHNGNIMISRDGHLVHIDFGFILGISPGGNLGFESAAFKLSHEMTQLLDPGGRRSSPQFRGFVAACVRGFLAARGAAVPIIAAIKLMDASGLPCYGYGEPVKRLTERFHLEMSDAQAAAFFRGATLDAYDKWTTGLYDGIQWLQQSIPK